LDLSLIVHITGLEARVSHTLILGVGGGIAIKKGLEERRELTRGTSDADPDPFGSEPFV